MYLQKGEQQSRGWGDVRLRNYVKVQKHIQRMQHVHPRDSKRMELSPLPSWG